MGSASSVQAGHHTHHDDTNHFLLGVRLSYCTLFIESHGGRNRFEGMTTAQVCDQIIRPATVMPNSSSGGMSYCEMLLSDNNPDNYSGAVDKATIFVSHCWSSYFLEVCDALENYFAHYHSHTHSYTHSDSDDTNQKYKDPVLWFDIFSYNQHCVTDGHTNIIEDTSSIIHKIGSIVLVLTSWKDPIPLKRSWCLWEMFATSLSDHRISVCDDEDVHPLQEQAAEVGTSHVENAIVSGLTHHAYTHFDIALTMKGEVEFMDDMITGAIHHVDHLREIIDLRHSESSIPSDHEAILHAVEHLVSLESTSSFNQKVFEILRQWIFHKLEATLHAHSLDEGGGKITDKEDGESLSTPSCPTSPTMNSSLAMSKKERYWTLKLVLGKLYVSQSDDVETLTQAEPLLVDSLLYCEDRYGEVHSETLSIQYHLARCYDKQGQVVKALELYQQCLTKQRELLGNENRDTFRTLTHYASLLYTQGHFEEALPLYEEGLVKRKELQMDLFGIKWMYCVANLYYKQAIAATPALKSSKSLLSLISRQPSVPTLPNPTGSDRTQHVAMVPSSPLSFNPKERQQQASTLYQECIDQLKRLLQDLTGRDYNNHEAVLSEVEALDHQHEQQFHDAESLLIKTLFNAAIILTQQEDYDDALPYYKLCLSLRRRRVGNQHPDTVKTIMNTAVTHFKMNESKEALVLYREYYDLKLAQVGLRHPETLAVLQNLAICHERLKNYDLAMSQYEECLQIRTEVLGSFHPETKSSEKAIEKLKKKIMRRKQLVSTSSFHEDDVDSVPVVVSQEKSETQS